MVTGRREIGLTVWVYTAGGSGVTAGEEVIFHLAPFYGRPRLNRYFGALKRAETAHYHWTAGTSTAIAFPASRKTC